MLLLENCLMSVLFETAEEARDLLRLKLVLVLVEVVVRMRECWKYLIISSSELSHSTYLSGQPSGGKSWNMNPATNHSREMQSLVLARKSSFQDISSYQNEAFSEKNIY